MSALFLKRFFQRPTQVASILPSSRTLIRKVADHIDFTQPRIIAEFGPGEGCHSREMARRMDARSHLLLFELDPELATHLRDQFRSDSRITVLNTDAAHLARELAQRNLPHCDYVVSGIPFSILEPAKKRDLLRQTYESLAPDPHAAFIIYQVTNELRSRGHCDQFHRAESAYCLRNLPPMFVTKFWRNGPAQHAGHTPSHQGAHSRHASGKALSAARS